MRALAAVCVFGAALAAPVELELTPDAARWAAFRDGAGSWQVQAPGQTRYRAEARERSYEWVVVCARSVLHFRLLHEEMPRLRWPCVDGSKTHDPGLEPLAEVGVRLSGLNQTRSRERQQANLYYGRRELPGGLTAAAGTLRLPAAAPLDLVFTRKPLFAPAPDRVVLFRQYRPGAGGALELDFSSPRALPLVPHLVQVTGLQIEGERAASNLTRWHTCGGTVAWLGESAAGTNPAFYGRLPRSAVRPCDRYEFSSIALGGSETGTPDFQMAFRFLSDPADVILPLPPLPARPRVSLRDGLPLSQPAEGEQRLSGPALPLLSSFGFSDQERSWEAWQPGTAAQSYAPPDLSGLDGWNPDWLPRGPALDWSYGVLSGNATPARALRAFQTGGTVGWEGPLEAADGLYLGFAGVGGRLRAPADP